MKKMIYLFILVFSLSTLVACSDDDVPLEVMDLNTEFPRMTLITCYGDFDRLVGTSKQRCVVVCEPVEEGDPRLAAYA